MPILPKALSDLINALGTLPGVGPRTAERYAYHLLRGSENKAQDLSSTISSIHQSVKYCRKTFALISVDQEFSPLYTDPKREKETVLVVQEPLDVVAIEKTGQYKGTYHVLGGVISPIDGVGPENLKISELLDRINEDQVKEVILATNATVEGDSTALYIHRQLMDQPVQVSRLARGLPVGVDLEYADHITIGHALEGRRQYE